ncbi:replication initiation protein [Priestia aryabhattai]|uniref:replication initiation protein n=1 Tax=Priestia aryabhattai TaxID=412384 RepID=UPI00159B991C|nr:replication initiation protein [Priestia aryabhattai]
MRKIKKTIKGEYKVTQHHALIESYHIVNPLKLQHYRIILTAISTIQTTDTEFHTYTIAVKELLKIFNITDKNHALIEKACEELVGKGIKIKDEKGWTMYPWFQKIRYYKKEGVIEFQFPNDLKPYLLQLKKKEGLTSYRLENILRLSSVYTQRIYEICFKWKKAGKCQFDIDHFKKMIGATQESYSKAFGSLKQRVLLPAVEEINEKTDIEISFKEIKTARKVTDIEFYIKENEKNSKKEVQPKVEETEDDVILEATKKNTPKEDFERFIKDFQEKKEAE